jgi:hypothetical protein
MWRPYSRLYLAFGMAFQVPIVVMLLARFNLVTHRETAEFRGYFIVVAFIIAAVVTPPDVISQLALAIPMCILYEAGILAAGWFIKVSKAPERIRKTSPEESSPESALQTALRSKLLLRQTFPGLPRLGRTPGVDLARGDFQLRRSLAAASP